MKNTRTGQRPIRKLLKGAGSAILLATLFVLVFAGTLSGAFGIENSLQESGITQGNVADAASTYTATLTSKTVTFKNNSSNVNTYLKEITDVGSFDYKSSAYSREGNSYTFNHAASYGYTNNSNSWGDEEYYVEVMVAFKLNVSTSKFYKIRSAANVALWVEGGGSANVSAKAATAISNTETAPSYDYPSRQNNTGSNSIVKAESASHGAHIGVKGRHDAVFANTSSANTDANAQITSANEITVRGGNTFYVFVKMYCWDDANTASISRALFLDSVSFIATETSPFNNGNGSEESPYLLQNRNDFDLLSYYLRTDIDFKGYYFKVQPDTSNNQDGYIDMLGTEYTYTPGGLYDSVAHGTFKGNFDGNNIEIKNLVISVGTDTARAGLIGTAGDGAVIRNVYIGSDSSVSSQRSDAAGVVGFATGTVTISGCKNYASVYSPTQNGGIVANVSGSGTVTISNCQNYGTISGYKLCGGIIGYAQTATTISGCVNNASAKVNCSIDAGGIVGYAKSDTSITGCTNNGTVDAGVASYVPYTIVRYDAHVPNGDEGVRNMIADRNQDTKYCTSKNGAMSFVIEVPDGVSIAKFAIRNANDTAGNTNRTPKEVYIWGSNTRPSLGDKTDKGDAYGLSPSNAGQSGWTSVYESGNIALGSTNYYRKEYSFSQAQSYKYYWVRIAGTSGQLQFSEFEVLSGIGDNVGGIVGYADGTSTNNVVIDSAVNSGAVTGNNNVGGIVGGGTYASLTTSATNSGNIKGVSAVGGIVGCAGDKNASNKGFSITNASNTGTITSTGGQYVGGITGYSRDTSYSGTIKNEGNITAANSSRVGGVVGFLYGGTLAGAVNSGDVQGFENVGGIVGVADWGTINGATNSGNVSVSTDTDDVHNNVGGIVGWIANANAYIIGSIVNTGNVSGDNNIGGIVGYNTGNVGFDRDNNLNGTFSVKNQTISGKESVGGIVGFNDTNGKIGISSFDNSGTTVTGSQYIGGVLGYCIGAFSITTSTDDALAPTNKANVKATSNFAGGFIGYTKKSGLTLANLINSGAISGAQYVGGIVGGVAATTTIENSVNSGTISGTGYVGGLVGGIDANTAAKLTITNSHNNEAVTSSSNNVGGLVGGMGNQANSLSIANSYNSGAITCTGSGGNVGGLVGRAYTTATAKDSIYIHNCYNTGDVSEASNGNLLGDSIGGIVGYLFAAGTNNQAARVEYCYNYAAISGASYVGGIVGSGTSTGYFTISYCYVTIDGTHNVSANTADTYGAIFGGAFNTPHVVSNFNVVNSWGFYKSSDLLSDHNTGASAYGAYLLNEFGKNVNPIIDGGQDTDWTKIVGKNISSFYIESGISVSNGNYLALLKENKSYAADTVKSFAKPSNINDLPTTVSTDGSVSFGVIVYSANTTTEAWNIHVYAEAIEYTAPDMEYIKAHLGTDNPEYTKQGKSAYYTWNNDAIRDGYFGQFTLRSGDDINVSEGGFTFDARIKIDGTDKIFGQKLNNKGDTIVARRLPVEFELLNATIMGSNEYRNADFGLNLIKISRLLNGDKNDKVLTIKKGYNSDSLDGGDVFVYSYNGEDVFTITGTFSATGVGTYTYTITIVSTNYVFESATGGEISTNSDTVKSWTYTITPYHITNHYSNGDVWFGAKYDANDTSFANNMVVTNVPRGTVTLIDKNGNTRDVEYYPLNENAEERPQALIYQNGNYKKENFVIYVRYSTGEVAALVIGSEYTLSELETAGNSHVNTGAKVSVTGNGNYTGKATKHYVILDSDFGWTSSDNTAKWGTASNPYVISTQAQLMRLSQILNGDKAWNSINNDDTSIVLVSDARAVATDKTYAGAYFVVTADIVLDGTFKPIGNNNENTIFKAASFASATSGQLVRISYYYNSENSVDYESRDYVGLFGNVQGTHFKDLYVVGTDKISGNNYVGGLVGRMHGGVIENCTFEGRAQVGGNNYVGGLIGYADGTQILFDTSYDNMKGGTDGNNTKLVGAQVSGANYVGGIAGKWTITSASQFNGGNAGGLYFAGTVNVVVESTGSYAGAIAGMLDASGCADTLEIKAISGTIRKEASAAQVSGINYVGTLYGAFIGNGKDKTTLVYNENSVYGTLSFGGKGKVAGGFVGYLQDATLKFNNNYTVNGKEVQFSITDNNTPSFFGGIVGVLGVGANIASGKTIDGGNTSYITLQNSVEFGKTFAFGDFVGGIVGYVSSGAGRSNMGSTVFGDDFRFVGSGIIYAGNYVGSIIGAIGIVDGYTVDGDFEGKSVLVNTLKNGSTSAAANNNIVTFKPASATSTAASVNGNQYVGGIVGSVSKKALAYFVNSVIESVGDNQTYEVYNKSHVVGSQYVGGIVGYLDQESHVLTRIVNIGKVGKAGASYVGGLVGYMVGGTIQNSVSAIVTGLNEKSDHYLGSQNVGGLVGFMQGGTLENCISTGFKFDGYNTSNTKGGVVGNVLSANIEGSWTIYLATSPTYASVSNNGNGKYVLVDKDVVSEVGSYANVLAMAGICKESANPTYDKQGELRIGVEYPTKSNFGNTSDLIKQTEQLAFYDVSGSDAVMKNGTSAFSSDSVIGTIDGKQTTLASANGIVRIGVSMATGESYSVCKVEVKFSNIRKYTGTNQEEKNLNAQEGYRAPSGADSSYRAEVVWSEYENGNITRIIANIYFKDILVGSIEGIVGGYDSGTLDPGSKETPLTIGTQEEWNDFAWSIYTGNKDYNGQYVKLLTDITIDKRSSHVGTNNASYNFAATITNNSYNSSNTTDKTNAKSNLGYNMAGNIAIGANSLTTVSFSGGVTAGSKSPAFKGTFDGDGHTITIKYEESASRASVFPNAKDATFKNLTVDGYVKATGLSDGENDTVRTMKDYHLLQSKTDKAANADEGIYKISDENTGTKLYSSGRVSFVAEFVAPLAISGFAITNGNDNESFTDRTVRVVKIWGSNKQMSTDMSHVQTGGTEANTADGWEKVYDNSDIAIGSTNGATYNRTFLNSKSYKYYWVYLQGSSGVQISEFGFLQGMGFDSAGFVGKPFGDLAFYNCKNMANVSAYRNAAGILGFNDQGYGITLEACVNEGDITSLEGSFTLGGRSSTYSYDDGWGNKAYAYGTGGIIGSVKGSLTIQSCRNTGTIVGGHNVGGIIGCSDGTQGSTATLVIDSCANSGFVLCNSGYWSADEGNRDTGGTSDYEGTNSYGIRLNIFGYVGGIVGRTGEYSILKMYASYNSGRVIGLSNMVGGMVGGVGYLYQPDADTNYIVTGGKSVIAYCYNIGEVSAGGTFPKHTANLSYVGGLIGTERKNDGGNVVGGIAGIVGNVDIFDCYNTGNITAYGITAYNRSWQLRAGGIVGQSEPLAGNNVYFKRCYNIGKVNSRHILNTMGAGIWDTATALRYGAGISGYCDNYNDSASRVEASDCYSIAYSVTLRVANQKSTITGYRSSGFNNWYSDQRNVNWLFSSGVAGVGDAQEYCVKTGDLCSNYRDLTAVMKSDNSINVDGGGWKTGNAYNNFNGTDTSFNLTASYGSIDANLTSLSWDQMPSGWIFVYGCLPQLAVFALDTYNGLSMRSVNYGRDVYGEYQREIAGEEYSPYIIKDGVDLLGLQTLVDMGYNFDGKYIEFADGTNNLENTVSKTINMPTSSNSVPSNSYKYTEDGTNYVGGKSYHLFERGAASDYTNWKAVNYAFRNGNTLAAGASFYDQNFIPIGRKGNNLVFKGNISGAQADGNTVIANLRIKYRSNAGLFGYVQDAEVRNITVSGNVYSYSGGSMQGNRSVAGGIVAFAYGSTIIDGCEAGTGSWLNVYAYGQTSTYDNSDIDNVVTSAGAIVGEINTARYLNSAYEYQEGAVATISNNRTVYADVRSVKNRIGGIVGFATGASVSYNAEGKNNKIEIVGNTVDKAWLYAFSATNTTNSDVGTKVGGIIGYSDKYISILVRDCVVGMQSGNDTVKIEGENRIGGIVGEMPDAVGEIIGCKVYKSATIKRASNWGVVSNEGESGTAIGGIVGLTYNAQGTDPITTTFSGNIVFQGKIVVGVATNYASASDRSNDGVVRNVGGIVGDMGAGARIATGSEITVRGTIEISAPTNENHANRNIGGVAGRTDDVAFSGKFDVAPTITATSAYQIGGFIGKNIGTVNILADDTDIRIGGNISASNDVGGFIGYNAESSTLLIGADQYRAVNYDGALSITIVQSVTDAEKKADINTLISASGDNVGGIVGNSAQNGYVQIVKGTIVNKGQVKGNDNVGGIIGINDGNFSTGGSVYGNATLEIVNEGKVEGNDYIGGVIGKLNVGEIAGRFVNKGNVSGNDYVGGSIGFVSMAASIKSTSAGKTEFVNEAVAIARTSDALVSSYASVADDSLFNVSGRNYVGGSIGLLLGSSLGNEDYKVEFRSKGTVNGKKYVGGSIGVLAGRTEYTDFISEGEMSGIDATTAVGGSVGFIGVPNPLINEMSDADIVVKNTHFEANGTLTLNKTTYTPSAEEEYVWGGIGGAIGAIGNATDNLFDNTDGTRWVDNTYYASGNVKAEGFYHVGGIVGLIKADNITIANMLAYDTVVTGAKNVGGIVGATIGKKTVIQSAFSISTNIAGGVFTATIGNAGGIIGFARVADASNGYDAADDTDASSSYWVKGYSNAELASSNVEKLQTTLGRYTLAFETWEDGGNTVTIVFTKELIGSGSTSSGEGTETGGDTGDEEVAIYPTPYDYYAAVGTHTVGGVTYTVNADEIPEDNTDNKFVLIDDSWTWEQYFAKTNPNAKYVDDANAWVEEKANWTQYSTGTKQTGWYFVYANDQDDQNSIGNVSAVHAANISDDETYWKRIADAYTRDERANGDDTANLTSLIVRDSSQDASVVIGGGEPEKGMLYATATSADFAGKAAASGYYMYIASSGDEKPTAKHGTTQNEDKFFIRVETVSDAGIAENVAVYYRSIAMGSALTYNGYERYAPISLQKDIAYDTTIKDGATNLANQNKYFYNTINQENQPKDVGTYHSTVNIYYFDDLGNAYIVGGIKDGTWRINKRKLTFTQTGMDTNYIYGESYGSDTGDGEKGGIRTTLTVGNVVGPDTGKFDFEVTITDASGNELARITWDADRNPNISITDNAAQITVSGSYQSEIKNNKAESDKKYTVGNASDGKAYSMTFVVTYKMAKTYKVKVSKISDNKNYQIDNKEYTLTVERRSLTLSLNPTSKQFDNNTHTATWTIQGTSGKEGILSTDSVFTVLSQFAPKVYAKLGDGTDVVTYSQDWTTVADSSNSAIEIKDGSTVVAKFEVSGNTIKLTMAKDVGEYYIVFGAPSDNCNYKFGATDASYTSPKFTISVNTLTLSWSTNVAVGYHTYDAATKGRIIATIEAKYDISDYQAFILEYFNQYLDGKKLDGSSKVKPVVNGKTATITFETSSIDAGKYSAKLEYSGSVLLRNCRLEYKSGSTDTKQYEIKRANLYVSYNIANGATFVYNTNRQGLTEVYINGILSNDKVYISVSGGVSRNDAEVTSNKVTVSLTDNNIDAATYTATVTLSRSKGKSNNYIFANGTSDTKASISWTITPKELSISGLTGGNVDYDATAHYPTIDMTGSGITGTAKTGVFTYNRDTIVVNYSITGSDVGIFVNAGQYDIKVADTNTITATRNGSAVSQDNYKVINKPDNKVTFTINAAKVEIIWNEYDLTKPFVYNKTAQGLTIASLKFSANNNTKTSAISGGKFAGYGNDKLTVAISGKQTNAGTDYEMEYTSHSIEPNTVNSGIAPIKENYVFVDAKKVSGKFNIDKSALSIVRSGGSISKVYDATRTVPQDQLDGLSYTITSTNGGDRSLGSNAFTVTATYRNENVGTGIGIVLVYSLKATYNSNYSYEGGSEEVAIGTITPATITVSLDKLRGGNRATRTFAENKDGINVYYGGANGAVNGQRSNRSQTYRLGEGFTIDGFPSAEASGVVRVLAKYVEVGNGRSAFDGYVNYIYDSGSGVFVKGTATSDYVVNNNLFKALEFSIEDVVDGSGKSANYRFHVVDSSKETISGDTDAQLGTNVKPVRVYDSSDKKNENVGKQSLGIEITVKTYKIKYGNTTQSYANADGTYNTEWLPVEAVDLPTGINVAVENGWMTENGTAKIYKEYTVIRGRQGSKELSASVSGQNGKQLNYNMTNQPVLTIGYFVETSGDVFEIGSLSSLMIASYYWWVSANSGNPEFNQVINTTVTWNTVVSDTDYEAGTFTKPAGAPDDVTTWDAYFEWLETEKKITVFLNENENNTWGYYTTSTGAGDVKKYSSFKQVRDINDTFTQSDIEMLNGFFRVYDVATDQYVTKEWGKGGEFITNFLKVGAGNVAVAIGSIFKSLDAGFTGSYDGGGYVIEYFNIMSFDGAQNAGMFDVLGITASVKNVHLRNFTITANGGNVGGIAGKALAGENAIENVSWHGTISMSGNGNAGGIIGLSARSIDKAIALGTITAKGGNIGGLIGSIEKDASASGNVTVANAVSFVYIDAEGNVGAIAGNAIGASVNNTFYLASSAWTRNGGTLTVSDGTLGIAKTYTQLIDGESVEGVVKAGSLSGYVADADGKKYYQSSQKGVYDMLDDFDLADNANRTSMNARQSLRLKDIIDVYMLMYSVKEVDVKVNTTDTETSKVYTISATSWLVNDKHGTDGNEIVIANRQQAALLRELRFASFILDADVVATVTSGTSYAYGGAFFGKVTVTSGKAYTIDFGSNKSAFEAYASGSSVPSKQNA